MPRAPDAQELNGPSVQVIVSAAWGVKVFWFSPQNERWEGGISQLKWPLCIQRSQRLHRVETRLQYIFRYEGPDGKRPRVRLLRLAISTSCGGLRSLAPASTRTSAEAPSASFFLLPSILVFVPARKSLGICPSVCLWPHWRFRDPWNGWSSFRASPSCCLGIKCTPGPKGAKLHHGFL